MDKTNSAKKRSISYQTLDRSASTVHYQPLVNWPPLKTYGQPRQRTTETRQRGTADDTEESDKLRQNAARMYAEIDTLGKIVLRLRAEVKFQIRFWERGLKYGDWESPDAIKRRLSALKGALEYLWSQCPAELQVKDEDMEDL